MGSDFQPAPIWLKFDRNDPDNTLFDNTLNRLNLLSRSSDGQIFSL